MKHFVKILYQHSLKKSSFIKDYGNKNLVTISEILNLFNSYYLKINKKIFKSVFKSKKANINRVKINKNTVFYKKKSLIVMKKFLTKSINEKKM